MATELTAAEIDQLRELHYYQHSGICDACFHYAPCPTIRALDALDRERRILHTLASTIESKSTDFASGHCTLFVGPITLADYDEWLAITATVDVTP